jgi:signal recognition particle subunit SEC65
VGIPRRISPGVQNRAVEQYRQGAYPTRTAREYDITLATLRKWVKSAGLEWVKPNLKNYPKTDERWPQFEAMHQEGRAAWEIKGELRLGERTYQAWRAHLGPVREEWKPPRITWDQWDQIRERYKDGQVLVHLAKEVAPQVSPSTVRRWLLQAGFPPSRQRIYE